MERGPIERLMMSLWCHYGMVLNRLSRQDMGNERVRRAVTPLQRLNAKLDPFFVCFLFVRKATKDDAQHSNLLRNRNYVTSTPGAFGQAIAIIRAFTEPHHSGELMRSMENGPM